MKLVFLSLNHSPEQTGIGKYQGEMAKWFAERGHDVSVVTAPPYYPEWKVAKGYSAYKYTCEDMDGTKVYRVPIYVPKTQGGLKRLLHLASFAISAAPIMIWLGFRKKPDAILMTAPPLMAAPVTMIAGFIARSRIYCHIQDFEVDAAFELGLLKNPKLKKLALRLEALALRGFDCVSTISPNMVKKLLDKGIEENKTALVPNWSNIEMFYSTTRGGKWQAKYKQNPDTTLVLYSGNLGRKQGLEIIVEAAKILNDNKNIHIIVSGDGAGREDMVNRAKGLDNISFIPLQPIEDFATLMLAADIHLLPQKAGAADLVMPSKLGNILASGRPVVVGAAQGTQVHEAVQGCGIAVEPENGEAFAQAILTLANDPDKRQKMGAEGINQANKNWGKEALLLKMETLLKG